MNLLSRKQTAVPLLIILLGLAVLIQYRFDREGFERLQQGKKLKYYKMDEGVHLVPSPPVLKSLSVGLDSILAEFLMLKSLNYFYQYAYSGRDRGYQNRLYSCVTELNPFYFTAYRYGGYFLEGPFRMKTDALYSFKKGAAALSRKELALSPGWRYPPGNEQEELIRKEYEPPEQAVKLMLETAVHYFAYLKDNIRGAEICRYGQRVFPRYTGYFLEKELTLRSEAGQYRMVMDIWQRFVEANKDDPEKKAAGIYRIRKYSSLHSIDILSKRIQQYRSEKGSNPDSLLRIAEPGECIDGFGDLFMYFRKTGALYSRMVEKENIETQRKLYIRKVKQWYKSNGSYPPLLGRIAFREHEYIHIPFDVHFRYDDRTGRVDLPLGFGRDICRVLFRLASAEYMYAAGTGRFYSQGTVEPLVQSIPDQELRSETEKLLDPFQSYRIGYIPDAQPFGLYAASSEQGIYIVQGAGPVYFRSDTAGIASWPEDMSQWKEAAR